MNSNEEKTDENETADQDAGSPRDCGGRGRGRWLWMVPLMAIAILLKGALVMWLWNALIPELFHGPELVYVQALGLMILAKLLVGFGHWRGHHHHRGRHRHHRHGGFGGFGGRDRWMNMTPEEREKMRDEFRRRCRF